MSSNKSGYDRPKKKIWSKSIETNGMTKKMEVREIENGFIVCIYKYGYSDDVEQYIDEKSEYYSKENPLADISIENKKIKEMKDNVYSPSIFE